MAFRKPKKTTSSIDAERVEQALFSRFNPISGLTPTKLANYINQFDAGNLSGMAQLMQKIEERDDVCVCVVPKRKKSVARHGFEIVCFEESAEAKKQKQALEYFFGGLTATSAIDEDVSGDINMLLEQMMDAEGKRWAAHEIVWQPSAEGLTATFRFVPLWFFEHTTSRLRYLPREGLLQGEELQPGEWLVTRGSGLMLACSILYVFKHLSLQDLLKYTERYAVPGLHGKTDAAKGSDEWNAMRDALSHFGTDWKLITNSAATIDTIDASTQGELPHPKLIERMDRAISAIWRGGDLSTLSAADSVGASVQQDETEILEDSDIELIEGTLNRKVVPYVIGYACGTKSIKAAIRIIRPFRADTEQERETDEFLIRAGCPVSKSDLLERYGRTLPDAKEELADWNDKETRELVNSRLASLPNAIPQQDLQDASNAHAIKVQKQLKASATEAAAIAVSEDMQAVADRLYAILDIEDAGLMMAALKQLQSDLPELAEGALDDPALATVLEDALAAATINGYAAGTAER